MSGGPWQDRRRFAPPCRLPVPFPARTVPGAVAAAGFGIALAAVSLVVPCGRHSAAAAERQPPTAGVPATVLATVPAGPSPAVSPAAPPSLGPPLQISGGLPPLPAPSASPTPATPGSVPVPAPPRPATSPGAAAVEPLPGGRPGPFPLPPASAAEGPPALAAPPPEAPAASGGSPPAAAVVPGLPLDLDLRADRQGFDAQLRRFVGTGRVTALVAGGRLMADRIEIDTESRTLYAFGSVRFQRGQQYLQASRLRYSLLEGRGEMQDVYGVLDLDGSATDLDLGKEPSTPLPPPEALGCPPEVPPPPQWQPYPWAVTTWAGQMFAANFGDTFVFKGRLRPEVLVGFGLQRRLLDAGPFALELDANLLGHRADRQPGGPFNQAVPFADTPSQTFSDLTVGIGGRLWLQPWLNIYFVEGVSLLSRNSNYERTFRENYSTFLNYLAFEIEALVSPSWSAVGRIHHRSGAYGLYSGVSEGSNAYLVGLRYRWGQSPPLRAQLELPPPQGCPGAPPPGLEGPRDLSEQLQAVTLGPSRLAPSPTATPATARPAVPRQRLNPWTLAREQERLRREAIARIDQRVSDVEFQQSLIAERRRGVPTLPSENDASSQFGGIRPSQLTTLNSESSRQLVRGTISRWRLQARLLRLTPTTLSGDRVGFTNDPFTPAQAWLDSTNVVATLMANGDTVITADRNRLRLEDRLPLPVRRETTIQRQEEVDNRVVLGNDQTDRDGFFLGYNLPARIGEKLRLTVQPQFLVQRAIDSSTDSYPLPDQSVQAPPVTQPATTSDLFGLEARLTGPLAGFDLNGRLEMSTFNPSNIADGTRSWGDLERAVTLPLLGSSMFRLFGAYRFRIWNGSLGQQDVYTAYGASFDKTGDLPTWGRLTSNYYWRVGVGNYQSSPAESFTLSDLWRGNAIASFNASLPIWTGKPAPPTPLGGMLHSASPVVPGLALNANVLGTLAYYGDGTNQNTLTLSGGPTLTLGQFVRPFLDFTQLTISGSGTLRQGLSPFGFDQAVDLGTLGIGLTQQIVGPLVFNGGIGVNIDPRSPFYGDVTGSYVELRWQRRAYEIGLYYSPYEGIGGVRVKLNDFNFRGPGVPFVPYNPAEAVRRRPF